MSTTQRSDALFGQDIDVDSFGGYAGQIPWFDWKLLGEKPLLMLLHGPRVAGLVPGRVLQAGAPTGSTRLGLHGWVDTVEPSRLSRHGQAARKPASPPTPLPLPHRP